MRKLRKKRKNINLQRKKKARRERMQLQNVLEGLQHNLSVKDIHRRTGLSEKNIRKILHNNAEELTFLMITRGFNNG